MASLRSNHTHGNYSQFRHKGNNRFTACPTTPYKSFDLDLPSAMRSCQSNATELSCARSGRKTYITIRSSFDITESNHICLYDKDIRIIS